jgi:uncharacterized membrane protein (DUF106 family)
MKSLADKLLVVVTVGMATASVVSSIVGLWGEGISAGLGVVLNTFTLALVIVLVARRRSEEANRHRREEP